MSGEVPEIVQDKNFQVPPHPPLGLTQQHISPRGEAPDSPVVGWGTSRRGAAHGDRPMTCVSSGLPPEMPPKPSRPLPHLWPVCVVSWCGVVQGELGVDASRYSEEDRGPGQGFASTATARVSGPDDPKVPTHTAQILHTYIHAWRDGDGDRCRHTKHTHGHAPVWPLNGRGLLANGTMCGCRLVLCSALTPLCCGGGGDVCDRPRSRRSGPG